MKNLSSLFVAAVAVLTVSATRADEPLLSPRAQANQIRTVPAASSAADRDLVREWHNLPGSPKGKQLAQDRRTVSAARGAVDLAHAQRPTLSPKDPRYEQALRENVGKQFQLAPLK